MSLLGVDSHAHVFDPGRPFAAERNYTPEDSQIGTVERFLAVLDHHGLSHGLLVAAEPYGTDNRCMLDAIAAAGGRLKGIALVDPDVTSGELDGLAAGGVIGIRFNLMSFGLRQFEHPATGRLLAELRERNWFLQVHCAEDQLAAVSGMLGRSGVRLMIDHFGRPDIARGISQPGFQALLELGRSGSAVVKLSGAFRSSRQMPPYRDVEPFVAAAVEAFTLDNCVWGSDWPFVRVSERIDYGPELGCVARWFPAAEDRERLLRTNPARLFGFA